MTRGQIVWLIWGCALAASLGVGLWRKLRLAERARRLLGVHGPSGNARARSALRRFREVRVHWLMPELLLLPIGCAAGEATRSPLPLLGAAVSVLPLRSWRLRRRLAAEARGRSKAVIELCAALAAEVRSGATPEQALNTLTASPEPSLQALGAEQLARLAAGRYGADVPATFQALARLPGGRGAAAIGVCWRVTAETGTGFATALDQLADALRAERALAEEIAGELAGPRATITVLAVLPVVGLALGGALGAKPVQVLLHTSTGLACLALGAVFESAGLAWTARIVRAAGDLPAGSPDMERARGGVPGRMSPRCRAAARSSSTECGISRVRRRRGGSAMLHLARAEAAR